jgi:hypothetical protein
MNAVNVAGIPFTENILKELQCWIVPISEFNSSEISGDIGLLLRIQSFLINNWESLPAVPDKEIRGMLVEIDYLRRRLETLNTVETGEENSD